MSSVGTGAFLLLLLKLYQPGIMLSNLGKAKAASAAKDKQKGASAMGRFVVRPRGDGGDGGGGLGRARFEPNKQKKNRPGSCGLQN